MKRSYPTRGFLAKKEERMTQLQNDSSLSYEQQHERMMANNKTGAVSDSTPQNSTPPPPAMTSTKKIKANQEISISFLVAPSFVRELFYIISLFLITSISTFSFTK